MANSDKKSWFKFPVDSMRALADALDVGAFGLACAHDAFRMLQGGNQWSAFDSFLAFFRHVVKLKIDYSKYDHWEQLALHSGPRVVHDEFCMISDRPTVLQVNDRNQPHRADGAFCEWSDGSAIYSLNGIFVPQWVVETPVDQFTKEMVMGETNADVRREIIRKIGTERLAKLLNYKVLDSFEEYELISFDIGDNRVRPYLKMTDPSTNLTHVEGVLPNTKTVKEGLAYKFSQKEWKRPMLEDSFVRKAAFEDFAVGEVVARHGDVLLKKTNRKVKKLRKTVKAQVLHQGQHHAHALKGMFYIAKDAKKPDERFVGVRGATTLGHDEHGPLKMIPKLFAGTELQVGIQMEYDHFLEESRQVID